MNNELVPMQKSGANRKLSDLTILNYGKPKIGKSSLWAKLPKAFFLDLNSGLGGLDVYKSPVITTWQQCLDIAKVLATPEKRAFFNWVVVDLIEEAYDMCLLHTCQKVDSGITHPSDINGGKGDFGKTWKEVTKQLSCFIKYLGSLGYGRILISHVREKDKPTDSTIFCRPNMGNGINTAIMGLSNVILYSTKETLTRKDNNGLIQYKEMRVMKTRETLQHMGGCHEIKGNLLPETIPLDYDILMKELHTLIGK